MEKIKEYLDDRNIESTKEILNTEISFCLINSVVCNKERLVLLNLLLLQRLGKRW